jgi:hypothetical protein
MFAILLGLLKRAGEEGRLRSSLAWIPVVMAVWVNLHGGWIVGFGVLGLWCAIHCLEGSWPDRFAIAIVLAIAFASTLVNPYGTGMWEFLAATVRVERPNITEWQPLYERPYAVWLSWVVGFAAAAIGAAHAKSKTDWMKVGIVATLGAAAVRVSRLDAFFGLAAIFMTIEMLRRHTAPVAPRASTAAAPCRKWAIAYAVSIALASLVVIPRVRTVPLLDEHVPDAQVATYVKDQRLKGKMLTWFTWGEYFIWHFGPDLKVSIDGRRETVYGPELISNHTEFYFGKLDEWRYADTLNADYVWIPKNLPVAHVLQQHGWSTLCSGERSILLSRHAGHQPCGANVSPQSRAFPEL